MSYSACLVALVPWACAEWVARRGKLHSFGEELPEDDMRGALRQLDALMQELHVVRLAAAWGLAAARGLTRAAQACIKSRNAIDSQRARADDLGREAQQTYRDIQTARALCVSAITPPRVPPACNDAALPRPTHRLQPAQHSHAASRQLAVL